MKDFFDQEYEFTVSQQRARAGERVLVGASEIVKGSIAIGDFAERRRQARRMVRRQLASEVLTIIGLAVGGARKLW